MLHIKSFYQKLQPQTVLEEMINFSLQGEVFFDEDYECKRFAILPHGNRLYTGAIQAVGYHYLNTTPLDTIIIIAGSASINRPIVCTEKQTEPIMGKKIQINQSLYTYLEGNVQINNDIIGKNKAINGQLPFIRSLTNLKIFPIIVPTKKHSNKTEDALTAIVNDNKNVGIICSTNHKYEKSEKNIELLDKKILNKLTKQSKTNRKENTAHLQLIHKIAQKQKNKFQLVLYNNTENTKQTVTTSHYCMIG